MAAKFYGVGVGPGDPELLTLKAYRVLEKVDLIFVPGSLPGGESLARSVVEKALPRKTGFINLNFPMSKDPSVLRKGWAKAGRAVAEMMLNGRTAAFITIGDPMLYSTYSYLQRYLKEHQPGLEIETIPGVTSFCAGASYAGTPLVEGDESLAVVPAAYGLDKLRRHLEFFDNVVVLKVGRHLPEVLALLKELGLAGKAVFINRCGYEDQSWTRDLEALPDSGLDYMSLLIIRKRGI